jgi:hypothetical protein
MAESIVSLASLGARECINPPKYSEPYELSEEYINSLTPQQKFEMFNKYLVEIGKSEMTYEEYLEWLKT